MKKMMSLITALLLIVSLGACKSEQETSVKPEEPTESVGATNESQSSEDSSQEEIKEKGTVNVAMVKGFSALSVANLMEANSQESALNNYNFTLVTNPDEARAMVLSGEADIVAMPTNMAATLYNKSEGQVQLLAVNTLNVVKLLSNDETIKTLEDLKGKEIHAVGQGAVPHYVFDYILKQNGIDPENDLTINYKPGHEEVGTLLSAGTVGTATLPEPTVTQVLAQNPDLHVVLDLTDEWNKIDSTSTIAQGCVVVQAKFASENAELLENFMKDYEASCAMLHSDLEASAIACGKFELLNEDLARKAIPESKQVYLVGTEMKEQVEPFFAVLFEANPESVGGKLPDDGFYYVG